MQTFDFPYHVCETVFPESSTKMTFGRGYEFVSKPKGPDQVRYILHFVGMQYVITAGAADRTTLAQRNILKLEDFYKTHRLYEKFTYPHLSTGNVTVRFAKPLQYKPQPGGLGVIEGFTVELISQP